MDRQMAISRYENMLIGKQKLMLSGTDQEKQAAALDIFRYVITDLLGWTPEEAKDGFHEITRNVYGNGHASLFKDVAEAIAEGRAPYVDARAGRRALETVLAIYQSSFTGQPVTLPLGDVSSKDFEGFFDR